MTQSILIANAMTLFHVTDLNVYILNKNNEFTFHHEMVKMPSFARESNEKELIQFSQKMLPGEKKVYSYATQTGLHYLGYPFKKKDPYTIIIGPYLSVTPNYHYLTRKLQLNNQQGEMINDYYSNLQLLAPDKVEGFINVLFQFEQMLNIKPERVVITESDKEDFSPPRDPYFEENETDHDIIELRYKVEKRITHAIATGNKKEAKNTFIANRSLFTFSERFPNQPMTRVKNLAVILNTLSRTAAKEGNAPSFLIHRVSEKYAHKIMYLNRIDQLQKLFTDMIENYCDLVLQHSIKECSKTTRIVIEYLVSNYDKSLNKEYLASITFTHPGHLSRKFKQDTGKTIIGYQQMLRIERAKYLLENNNLPIEEIAWLVGYEDTSYFSRVFKKEIECTPTEYRINTEKTNSQ